MKLGFVSAALMSLLFGAQAYADVTVCNRSGRFITLAVAAIINQNTNPQWSALGWWNLDSGSCATPYTGSSAGLRVYYHAQFSDGSNWIEQGASSYAPVCVPNNGSKFTRLGTARDMVNCPYGWSSRPFYETYTERPNRTINLY